MNTSQDQLIKKIGDNIDILEIPFVLMVAIALILKYFHLPFSGMLLTIFLCTLSCIYFFAAFAFINNEYAGPMDNFFNKIIYWGLAEGLVGILFRLQHWPNWNIFISIGGIAAAVGIAYVVKSKADKPEATIFNNRTLLRLVVMAGVCAAIIIDAYA